MRAAARCDGDRLEREARLVGVAEVVDVELLDARAAVGDVHGEPERLELADGLAHRGDARAERARELLEPQRRARGELAREDALAQLGGRGIGQCRDAGSHIQAGCHRTPSYPVDHVSQVGGKPFPSLNRRRRVWASASLRTATTTTVLEFP